MKIPELIKHLEKRREELEDTTMNNIVDWYQNCVNEKKEVDETKELYLTEIQRVVEEYESSGLNYKEPVIRLKPEQLEELKIALGLCNLYPCECDEIKFDGYPVISDNTVCEICIEALHRGRAAWVLPPR